MSSFSVIQNHDSFLFAVDTAVSCVVDGVIYRVKDTRTNKAHYIGKDMIFIAGNEPYTEMARDKIHTLINNDGHVNVNGVQEYFRNEIPAYNNPSANKNISQVGVSILRIINGKTSLVAMEQLYNDYQIIQFDAPIIGYSDLHVDGFKNTELSEKIKELYSQRRFDCSGFDNILEVYRNNYSEGIGNEILVGTLDQTGANLIYIEKLKETGLRYVEKGFNVFLDGSCGYVHINGGTPITSENILAQTVDYAKKAGFATNAYGADYATTATSAAYLNNVVTANNAYMTPISDAVTGCGSSYKRWVAVFASTGTIVTSDRNKKNSIKDLDERYLNLAKMLNPKSYKMNEGTSGRTHLGFIAQEVEEAMATCGISDLEFAGLCKDPIYAKKLKDEEGNELPEYDTTSEITGYNYSLRYDEFIPLLLARIEELEQKANSLQPIN